MWSVSDTVFGKASFLELILRNNNYDFRHRASCKELIMIYLHTQIELDLLRALYASRHHQNSLTGCGPLESETRFRCTLHTWRCTRFHERHTKVHRRAWQVISFHPEQFLRVIRSNRQHAHESDVIVRVMGRWFNAGCVGETARPRSYASAIISIFHCFEMSIKFQIFTAAGLL